MQKGNFDYQVGNGRYQRKGNQFIFTNANGRYTSSGNGQIAFVASNPTTAQAIALLPPGSSARYAEGSYTKQWNGKVMFEPARILPAVAISGANCYSTMLVQVTDPAVLVPMPPQAVVVQTPDPQEAEVPTIGQRIRDIRRERRYEGERNLIVGAGETSVSVVNGQTVVETPGANVVVDSKNGIVVQTQD